MSAGRPSLFTPEMAELILEGLAAGRSLVKICADPGMVSARTAQRWQSEYPEFGFECGRARELGGEVWADKSADTAEECDEDNAHAAKVKISAYQWYASKIAPKGFGERLRTEVSGPNGGPIETKNHTDDMTDADLAAIASRGRAAPTEPPEGED